MQPGQEIDIPNRPITRRRPVAARPASAAGAGASVPVDNGPTFGNGASVVGAKSGGKTGWILTMILLLLIAAGGVGFGVWAYMDGNTQKDQLNSQISTLQQQNNDLQEQIEEMAAKNNTTGSAGDNANMEGDTFASMEESDFIVLDEWGVKIRIGTPFVYVAKSMKEDCDGSTCSIRITALTEEMKEIVDKYPDLGVEDIVHDLAIVKTKESELERYPGEMIKPIFNDGEYNYFVLVPSGLSLSSELSIDESSLITKAFDAFVEKVNTAENYSKI